MLRSIGLRSKTVNPLSAKKSRKSKVKVTLCHLAHRLPALPSLITSQCQSLAVSLSDIVQFLQFLCTSVFMLYIYNMWHYISMINLNVHFLINGHINQWFKVTISVRMFTIADIF